MLLFSFQRFLNRDFAIQEISVYPERGLIFDRNGELLVANQPMYELIIIPENTVEFDTIQLSNLIGIEQNDYLKEYICKKIFNKTTFCYKSQISKEKNAFYRKKSGYLWILLRKNSVRDYIRPFASNVIGYTSEVDQNDINSNLIMRKER